MLDIQNLSVQYAGNDQAALSDVNLSFKRGEFVCVLGKSGAGKSTLIRCINGLLKPTNGEVHFDGKAITMLNEADLRQVRREMGMIFQHFNLIPRLTVLQNVLTGTFGYRSSFRNLIGWFSSEELERAHRVIADVGLTDQTKKRVERLSGGQKQRVGIARALLQRPKVLLGDEPVSSLDPGTSNHIFTLLKKIHDQHQLLTLINVHDVNLAKRYATRIIAVTNGKITFDGAPNDFNEEVFELTYQ
ncbi:phosphonate ABC transporter ATP-binding protein [Salinibacillus xinjiangensis]|uniref:Phosphonate ABC transporter ATP-binding protein n=1 Tax=Salinibacillus xinjiangensis TaxID=1229268 RepID=A0A6G1X5I0_9BACI|nr:phosphonate ABC transporter ATP-binding protein [Salinibacillus xinjiangensis]MRG86165.1 phosphonate ABC transporter ATP-binding protein [Salinibacillus xinjiangensis]